MNPQKLRSAKPTSQPLVIADPLGGASIKGRGVSTMAVYNRWAMGEDYEAVAATLNVTVTEVIMAVHYELGRASRNRPLYWEEIMSEEYWE